MLNWGFFFLLVLICRFGDWLVVLGLLILMVDSWVGVESCGVVIGVGLICGVDVDFGLLYKGYMVLGYGWVS